MSLKREKIVSIRKIQNTGQYVYDFEVPSTQAFLANDIIVHNTDSIFVPLPGTHEDIDKLNDDIVNPKLVKFLNEKFHLTTNIVHLEYEKAYRKMIMVDKKRYTGTMMWLNGQKTDMIFSKGLEDAKKNTIGITKRAMRDLSKMVTYEDKGKDHIVEWLNKLRETVFDEKTSVSKEDLIISTRLSKPTYKYASKSAHVILAEQMVEKGLILQPSEEADAWGTRIDYIISASVPKQTAVHVDDYDGTWDRRYYWDTQIYAPIMRILQTIWPEHSKEWASYSLAEQEKLKRAEEKEIRRIEREKEVEARAQRKIEREEAKKAREEERLQKKAAREEAKKQREEERVRKAAEREEKKKPKQKSLFEEAKKQ